MDTLTTEQTTLADSTLQFAFTHGGTNIQTADFIRKTARELGVGEDELVQAAEAYAAAHEALRDALLWVLPLAGETIVPPAVAAVSREDWAMKL